MNRYDKKNMGLILEKFRIQCKDATRMASKVNIKFSPSNIIICGMGGSGIGAKLIKKFEGNIPIFSHQDYFLPKEATESSLVIIISYSGNTEEAISSYKAARDIGAKVISITSGGMLKTLNNNSIIIPEGYSPRAVAGYLFLLPLLILSNNGLLMNQDAAQNEALKLLDSDKTKTLAERYAKVLKGKIPLIYTSGLLEEVGYSFKTHINENAKQPAFNNVIPEMNHNELEGFRYNAGGLATIFIEDKDDNPKIKKRIEVNKKLLSKHTKVLSIKVEGESLLAKILYTMYLTDYISYFMALNNKVDPSIIPMIDELKKEL